MAHHQLEQRAVGPALTVSKEVRISPTEPGLLSPLAALALVSATARLVGGSWLAPVAFFPLCWTGYLAVAILLAASFPLYPPGLWIIAWLVLAFTAGGMLVTRPAVEGADPTTLPSRGRPDAGRVYANAVAATLAFSLVASMGIVWMFAGGVASFGLSLDPLALLRLGYEFSVARYGGGSVELPLLVDLLVYFTWPASVLGGVVFASARGRSARLIAVLPLLLAFARALLTTQRSAILTGGVLWVSAVLAVSVVHERGTGRLFRASWVATAGAAALVLVGIYAALQWVRGGLAGQFNPFIYAFSAIEAFFGAVSVFTHWCRVVEPAELTWGAMTFAGPFDLLQVAERRQGLYDTFVYFAWGSSSNIYTMFRGLIEDFGYGGAWLACFAVGAASTAVYQRCSRGLITWSIPLSIFYAGALYSIIISTFVNNSVIVGWVIATLVLIWPSGATPNQT